MVSILFQAFPPFSFLTLSYIYEEVSFSKSASLVHHVSYIWRICLFVEDGKVVLIHGSGWTMTSLFPLISG